MSLYLAALLYIYFSKLDSEMHLTSNTPFDIFFAFLGGYGRSKELEAALRDWTNRYQLILANATEAIVMFDSNGCVADANAAAGKLFGCKHKELLGRKFDSLINVTDSEEELSIPAEKAVRIKADTVVGADEGSSPRHISASLSPIKMHREVMSVMIARDITEELALAEEQKQLEEQVAHSQRLESLGMLAGGIAHDFNNYIHAILGHVDVINYMHPPEDPEVVSRLDKITSISEQAGRLTSQLLGFARKGKYAVTRVDMPQLLNECIELIGTQKLGEIDISRDIQLAPEKCFVSGDRVQMQQVLVNLIINAADALAAKENNRKLLLKVCKADDCGVALTPPAELNADTGNYLCIECADNGCGIDEQTMKRIFEPFFTTKPIGAGTGMGLAMVYGTISHHHGWIQVSSTPGEGTSFKLFLPISEINNSKKQ
jgi:PAS domain S-box-containing protein